MDIQYFVFSAFFNPSVVPHKFITPVWSGKSRKKSKPSWTFFVTSVFFKALRITSPVAVFPWRRFRFKVKLLNKQVEYGNEYWYSFVGTNNFAKENF